jgi:hypothetical protein
VSEPGVTGPGPLGDRTPIGGPDPSGWGERPGAWAELPPEEGRRRFSWRSTRSLGSIVVWAAVWTSLVYEVGLGGWRFGWLIAVVTLGAGTGLVTWSALGPGVVGRGLWVAAVVVAGSVLAVKLSDWAPMSTARIDSQIDQMRIGDQLWQRVSEHRLGHGWCAPRCPEVIRVYRSPNNSDAAALAVALTGLHEIGLVHDIRDAYNHQRGPDIFVGGGHLGGVVSITHDGGRAELTIDLRSKR